MHVFLLGITGGTGSRIGRLLVEQGHTIAGLYRHPSQIAAMHKIKATPFAGDIATIDVQELAEAMRGSDAVVFTAGAGEQDDESMIDAVDYGGVKKTMAAMQRAGISRLLLISVFPEAARELCLGDSFEHYIAAKKKADVEVVKSGLDWIILRPSSLKDDPGTGRVSLSLANFHTQITRDDVAATAVALLTTPAISRKILEVTEGEQAIAEAVAELKSF